MLSPPSHAIPHDTAAGSGNPPVAGVGAIRILLAGLGDGLQPDEGFGSEVARRLRSRTFPRDVSLLDLGSGGLDPELLRGSEALVLVDASCRGDEPGTLFVVEPDFDAIGEGHGDAPPLPATDPLSILRCVKSAGGWPGLVRVLTSEPAVADDFAAGLSPAIADAAERAMATVDATIVELRASAAPRAAHQKTVRVAENALDANDTIARANRDDFDRNAVVVVNFMSAPGAGKTALLERALATLSGELRIGVLEGDVVQGHYDAERLAAFHVPVTQINTDPGFGGECHLDANMVRSALPAVPLGDIDLLVVENVGNLVCPAEFRVGEDHRVMVASVTEGEDKPLEYPLMFRACDLVLVNKVDLLPHLDFDVERFLQNVRRVNPGATIIRTSARDGTGIGEWCDWLREVTRRRTAA